MTTRTNRASIRLIPAAVLAVPTLFQVCPAAPLAGALVREAVELAFRRSGREVAEKAAKEAVEQSVEVGVAKYGPRAAQAVAEGGVELVEAVTKYGDDVMRVTVDATPATVNHFTRISDAWASRQAARAGNYCHPPRELTGP